jgi:hypothetical protein
VPKVWQYMYRILCHGKFGQENSFYDMKWHITPPPCFTFRLLDYRFLCTLTTAQQMNFLLHRLTNTTVEVVPFVHT